MDSSDTPPAVDDDDILSIEVGGKSVGERLGAAIATGRVRRRPDGKLELRRRRPMREFIGRHGEFGRNCAFLNGFMFTEVYGESAVPIGCRDCYKVKASPQTLRELMAVKEIAEEFSCSSKSGCEIDKPTTQSIYATYLYFLGLDKARGAYRWLRALVDAHPKLGPAVKIVIKRGCTNYEQACGPSDRYSFDPRLAAVEDYFEERFASPLKQEKKYRDAMTMLELIRTAFRIGDDTYRDFTDGKALFPPTVTYDP